MPKFSVWGVVTGTKYLGEFEAATKEEAEQMALDGTHVSICHQCSRECEDPEVHQVHCEEVESSHD
jgi:hypothetical protein